MIPDRHLHHLVKLLSRTKPRTREVFLRLLSVLTTLRTSGGEVYAWEWNALVHCAGRGWRKTTVEDYRTALGVFKDMVGSGQMSPSSNALEDQSCDESIKSSGPEYHVRPDIITFTTLIDIAARTTEESALRHATSLLNASRIPWNSKTHRAMIPHYIRTNQLRAIPGILAASIAERLDIRAINNCMWAYACKGRLRVAIQVYDHLRRNVLPGDRLDMNPDSEAYPATLHGYDDFEENPILATPGFIENATMPPDVVTYTLLTQALCYRGDLRGALTVFRDMITTVCRPSSTADPNTPRYYKPTSAIYRAIFLGFARHANEKRPAFSETLLDGRQGIDEVPLPEFAARLTSSTLMTLKSGPIPKRLAFDNPWTLANLEAIFDRFLELDWDEHAVIGEPAKMPSDRMIYWIMVAYAKCSNQDVRKMYTIWKKLDRRFQFGVFSKSLSQRLKLLGRELERRQVQEKGRTQHEDTQ
ncbi:hypothetical protein BU17DRAFT_37507 [Hysterangium stoloniferum]|nr:hypothetical protein BU17DRAFT_37507 [Hysterangium stoloniferum]